jgi:Domain of unknown function (DUF4062)
VYSTSLCVFVSSTWLDLQPERKAVEVALQRLRETKFVGMEYFGSRDENTHHTFLDEVNRSQVYVGIFGGRYGSGITEAEYRRAREQNLTCFIYFKDEAKIPTEGLEADSEKAAHLVALKEEVCHLHTITTFTTPDDLAAKVTTDLHRWLFDEYLGPRLEKATRGEFPREEAQALLARLQEAGDVMAPGERAALPNTFSLTDHPDYRADWERLDRYARELLDDVRTTIPGLYALERTEEFTSITRHLDERGLCFVAGESGSGKSALAKTCVDRHYPCVLWVTEELIDAQNVTQVESRLDLQHPLIEVLIAASSRCLVVFDSVERYFASALRLTARLIRDALIGFRGLMLPRGLRIGTHF